MNTTEAGKKLGELTKQYQSDHPEMDSWTAFNKILAIYPELKEAVCGSEPLYLLPDEFSTGAMAIVEEGKKARDEADSKIKEHMKLSCIEDYEQAMREVFAADPALKEAYAQS